MNRYDILVILDPTAAADHFEVIRERLETSIKSAGGAITNAEHGGLRKLSYPIKGQTSGAYLLLRGEFDPHAVQVLRTKLTLDKEVLRLTIAQGTTLSFQERAVIRQPMRAAVIAPMTETKTETIAKPAVSAAIQLEELEKKVEQILEQPTI